MLFFVCLLFWWGFLARVQVEAFTTSSLIIAVGQLAFSCFHVSAYSVPKAGDVGTILQHVHRPKEAFSDLFLGYYSFLCIPRAQQLNTYFASFLFSLSLYLPRLPDPNLLWNQTVSMMSWDQGVYCPFISCTAAYCKLKNGHMLRFRLHMWGGAFLW